MPNITALTLADAVVAALQAATTTQLAQAKVYLGDQTAWTAQRALFVIWRGSHEEGYASGPNWWDVHTVEVVLRQTLRDEDETVAAGTWERNFLNTQQEVRDLLCTPANRQITDANGASAYKMVIGPFEAEYGSIGATEFRQCSMTFEWYVPQAQA